jgi:thiol-disulfide isomerase/thioredoxin
MDGRYLFFSYRGLGNDRLWDSTIVKQGRFQFQGTISQPAKSLITILETNRTSTVDPNVTTPLFIEPAKMSIVLILNHFRSAKLVGSKSQNEFMELENSKKSINRQRDPLIFQWDELNEEFEKKNAAGANDSLSPIIKKIDLLNSKIASFNNWEFRIDKAFFKKHPNSYITVYKIVDDIRHFTLAQMKSYYKRMSPSVQQSEYGKDLSVDILKMSVGEPGTIASSFRGKEINGDSINLSDFKGKYVLLDFWASWCKPCRAGNPELKKLYLEYRDKGIEFIGLASDNKSIDKWKAAVEVDGIGIWKQALMGDIGDLYHIEGLPTKIIIDPHGKIIWRDGENSETKETLPVKLKRLFDK